MGEDNGMHIVPIHDSNYDRMSNSSVDAVNDIDDNDVLCYTDDLPQ